MQEQENYFFVSGEKLGVGVGFSESEREEKMEPRDWFDRRSVNRDASNEIASLHLGPRSLSCKCNNESSETHQGRFHPDSLAIIFLSGNPSDCAPVVLRCKETSEGEGRDHRGTRKLG